MTKAVLLSVLLLATACQPEPQPTCADRGGKGTWTGNIHTYHQAGNTITPIIWPRYGCVIPKGIAANEQVWHRMVLCELERVEGLLLDFARVRSLLRGSDFPALRPVGTALWGHLRLSSRELVGRGEVCS
jgi:hypothetical protein